MTSSGLVMLWRTKKSVLWTCWITRRMGQATRMVTLPNITPKIASQQRQGLHTPQIGLKCSSRWAGIESEVPLIKKVQIEFLIIFTHRTCNSRATLIITKAQALQAQHLYLLEPLPRRCSISSWTNVPRLFASWQVCHTRNHHFESTEHSVILELGFLIQSPASW